MELWVAKDNDGEAYLYEKEPVDFDGDVWFVQGGSEMWDGLLAAKIGAALKDGQKAIVKSFNIKTEVADLDICLAHCEQLMSTVERFLSGSIPKTELRMVFESLSKPSK